MKTRGEEEKELGRGESREVSKEVGEQRKNVVEKKGYGES